MAKQERRETCVFAYSRHTLLLTRGSLRKSEQAVEERLSVSSLLLGLRDSDSDS